MSADNWAPCPMCKRPDSLREDYSIGIIGGKFSVSYGAQCFYFEPVIGPGCGFEYRFEVEKEIER